MSAYASVSAVIPTFNRKQGLARTLASLVGQAGATPLEVVVVDDGSTDGTPEWLESQRFPFALRCLRQANAGPAPARNAGLGAATGELILFLDDDVEALPGLVEAHLATHGERRDLVVMGPLGTLPSYPQPWVSWEQAQLDKQYRAMQRGDWGPTFRQFWTGNASVSRAQLLEADGFDRTFPRAEDVELGLRLHRRGLSFRFEPRARVLHHARRSLDAWCETHRRYGVQESRMYEGMDEVLRENWLRLHASTRALVRACLGRAAASAVVVRSLRGVLRLCERTGATRAAYIPCSLLANVLLWDALARTAGPDRFRAITGDAAA